MMIPYTNIYNDIRIEASTPRYASACASPCALVSSKDSCIHLNLHSSPVIHLQAWDTLIKPIAGA
jgi:hypothetical protein